MKKFKYILTLLTVTTLFLMGCSSSGSNGSITIGSKDFTESLIVSEIYALALEDNGYEVDRVPSIASSVIPQTIETGEIDLYPEYTGTALLSIFNLPMEKDPDVVAETIREAYEEDGVLTTLDYSPANDSQGIAITVAASEEYGIDTISDLQANAENIRFASQGEFEEREDGLTGLSEVYGEFDFESITVYDNSLKYQVLSSDEADATPAYTTEGQLANTDMYKVLEDDLSFWPPYNLVPVIRQEVLDANPEIASIINDVSATLDTQTVIELNARVDIDGEDHLEVAQDYYNSIN